MTPTLVDTGPLVAIITETDHDHRRCVAELRGLTGPLLTTWPVVTEAMYLLGETANAALSQDALLAALDRRAVAVTGLDHEDVPRIRALLQRYRDLPMDLADATLVRVAERDGIRRVFTLDRRDFAAYRIGRREAFTILPSS